MNLEQYSKDFGIDFSKFIGYEMPHVIRVNTIKTTPKKLYSILSRKGFRLKRIDSRSFEIRGTTSPGATAEYLEGMYTLQEKASQRPVVLLEPKEDETVLDMCASPGGKTVQIANGMKNKGVLIALDIKTKRLEALRNNLMRCSVKNTIIYNKDGRYASDLGIKFDKILVDAPCSGNFMVDLHWTQKEHDIPSLVRLQKQLLSSALRCIKDDGKIVYSTCSLDLKENEDLIKWAVEELKVKVEKEERLLPPETQAFYCAVLRK